jgi:hypothetical protein
MRRTRLIPLALVSLALVSACGPAAALGGGGTVKDGRYTGLVGPGFPISFRVTAHGTSVSDLVVGFEESCNGASAETAPLFHFAQLEIKGGKFAGSSIDRFGSTASDSLRISGTFRGAEATGKLTDTSKIKSLPTCTESEPFTARAK